MYWVWVMYSDLVDSRVGCRSSLRFVLVANHYVVLPCDVQLFYAFRFRCVVAYRRYEVV